MHPLVLGRDLTNDLVRFARNLLGLADRRVFGQTDINVGDVEVVSRKELAVKMGQEEHARRQGHGRGRKNLPPMVDGEGDRSSVGLPEAALAWTIRGRVLPRFQDVVRQERKKRHRHHAGGHEGTGNRHRQAVDVLPDIALQQQERQVGGDVGNRGVHDGF